MHSPLDILLEYLEDNILGQKTAETEEEELLELAHELQEYERKYEMRSSEFFERLQREELGDDMEWIDWAGTYQLFQRLKRRVELALMQTAGAWRRAAERSG